MPNYRCICVLEDHSLAAGFGSAVLELINSKVMDLQCAPKLFGVFDAFVPPASQDEQAAMNGFDMESVYSYILSHMNFEKRRPGALAAVG
ncbi:MAG: hypothetical protein DCC75_08940 [Proteobacteria bacterium]|nr:MAG: hypothetical protein DCC75_08940 [Pseudomonadota bacterium]